jgi:hypothetical protein
MKKISALFAISIMFAAFSANVFGQSSATATATATIVTPISIANAGDMNFGNIAVSSSAGGTVVLAPAGTRTTTGSVTLPATTGTFSAAHFNVTGNPNYSYAITLPSTPTTVTYAATNTMTVNVFTSDPTPTGLLDGTGKQTINVGATLNVSAAQAAGTYVSGTPFTVSVNYN